MPAFCKKGFDEFADLVDLPQDVIFHNSSLFAERY